MCQLIKKMMKEGLILQPDLLVKKIKENLLSQKEKLEKYLDILEKEEADITQRDADKLLEHIKIEQNIIEELNSFKKILEPLEKIYFQIPYKKEDTVFKLKESINSLSTKVKDKSENNKKILNVELEKIKVELNRLNKNSFSKNIYENNTSKFIDINS